MEHQNGEGGMWAGLAGFAGDVLWEVAQIGQGLLDALTVVLVALLIYQHGAAEPVAAPERAVVEHGALGCDPPSVPDGVCVMPLDAAAS